MFIKFLMQRLPRTPRPTKVDDEEPDHNDSRPTSSMVSWPLVLILGEDDSDDEVAQTHAQGTESQSGSSSDSVNVQDGGNCGQQHGNAYHARCKKRSGVRRQTERAENLRGIVKDGIDT